MISCYLPDSEKGLIELYNTRRLLYLNSATPPSGFNNTLSQILFSEDGSTLYAAAKGDFPVSGTDPGFIAAWNVDPSTGALSSNFVKSLTPANGNSPFGVTFIKGTNSILATDPVLGYDIFEYETPSSVAKSTGFVIPGQIAVCWIRFSSKTGNYYMPVSG